MSEISVAIILVYGCEFEQRNDKSVTITQSQKLTEVEEKWNIFRVPVKRSGNDFATKFEATAYESTSEKWFFGHMSQPIMLRIVSQMATKTNSLLLHRLKELSIAYRVESHDTTFRVYCQDSVYRANSLDAACTEAMSAATLRRAYGLFGPGFLGIPVTFFNGIRCISIS